MTRTFQSVLLTCALAAASARAQDLPLPGADKAPARPADKPEAKKPEGDLELDLSAPKPAPKKPPAELDLDLNVPARPKPDARKPAADAKGKKPAAPALLDLGLEPVKEPAKAEAKKPAPDLVPPAEPTKAAEAKRPEPRPAEGRPAPAITIEASKAAPPAPVSRPAERPATASLGGASAGAAAPVGAATAAAPSRAEKPLWSVAIYAGAERSQEQYFDGYASLTRLGIEGTRSFAGHFLALASFDWRNSRQGYVVDRPTPDGSPRPAAILTEQRYDAALGIGYDFGPRLLDSGKLALVPTLAFRYLGLRNEAFPSDLIGGELGLRSSFELSSAVSVHAGVAYAYNFSTTAVASALGAPKGDFRMGAGLALPLAGGYQISLDYVGDVLAFANVYRLAHGASLGFGVSF